MMLDKLTKVVDDINTTNSILDKRERLSRYPEIKEILYYVYNPMYVYHVTSKSIHKYKQKDKSVNKNIVETTETLIELLDTLRNREYTGHNAIKRVLGFIRTHPEHEELILKVIDKDLKIRMGVKQINAVFQGLIPEFVVALAERLDKHITYFEKHDEWLISRKLDGARCIAITNIKRGVVSFYSREGREFLTLTKVRDLLATQLLPALQEDMVIDGEICIMKDGVESFSSIMKEIKKSNHTIDNPCYKVFDFLTRKEFDERNSTRVLKERLELYKKMVPQTQLIHCLEQSDYTPERLSKQMLDVEKYKWEGLMLRRNIGYEGKRTKNILKVKSFEREEYKVVSMSSSLISNNGSEFSNQYGLKSVQIIHRGCIVDVGSGFSCNERKYYHEHPDKIIGKTISVQFFEETNNVNKQGHATYSLRFPTFKGLYGDERDF